MTRIVGLLSFLFPRRLLGFLVVFTALAVAIACGNHGSPTAPSSTTGSGGCRGRANLDGRWSLKALFR